MDPDSIRPVDVRTSFAMGAVREAAETEPRYDSLMRAMNHFGKSAMETLASRLEEATNSSGEDG